MFLSCHRRARVLWIQGHATGLQTPIGKTRACRCGHVALPSHDWLPTGAVQVWARRHPHKVMSSTDTSTSSPAMTLSFNSTGDGSESLSGADSDTRLGAADAALALDEELSGAPLGALSISDHRERHVRWSPGMGAATVVVLEGATPEFKIRRVCAFNLEHFRTNHSPVTRQDPVFPTVQRLALRASLLILQQVAVSAPAPISGDSNA